MTARPVGDGDGQDELRGLLDGALADAPISTKQVAPILDALLPVVTAWADARARERAAEELRAAADAWDARRANPAGLRAYADALAADGRTGQR